MTGPASTTALAGVGVALLLWAAAASAEPSTPQPTKASPATSAASAEGKEDPAPPATELTQAPFSIRRSVQQREQSQRDPESGAIVMIGIPLRVLVGQAWDVHPLDIESRGSLDLDERYDVLLRPGGRKKRSTSTLLRKGLVQSFAIQARREERTTRVDILERQSGVALGLSESDAERTTLEEGPGEVRATRASMRELQNLARWRGERPVVDETGLGGVYDWVLDWDPEAEASDAAGFLGSVRKLGLQWTSAERPFPFLVIEPAR